MADFDGQDLSGIISGFSSGTSEFTLNSHADGYELGNIISGFASGAPDAQLAHWGFNEANETDSILDDTVYARHLTLTNPVSVVPGRSGNARQFNGTSTFAAPASSTPFQILEDLTVTAWVKLGSFNSGGSLLRTVVACDGPTTGDSALWGLYVDSSGRLVYRHDAAGLIEVRVESSTNAITTSRYYFVQMVRTTTAGVQTVELRVDNRPLSVTVKVGGSPSAFPVSPPAANTSSTFSVGRSSRFADTAFWDGTVDDLTIYSTTKNSTFLLSEFFRIANPDVSNRLSTLNNVRQVASADMNGGIRWWTYERDLSLYVVRESPFGVFDPEVQLTISAATVPGGSDSPNLVYEPLSDTLVVVFLNAGRVYKLTATATDAPTTQNMPFTSDTPTIIKVRDLKDATRIGAGGPKDENVTTFTPYTRLPALPTITLATLQEGFGVLIPNIGGTSSWRVYERRGGSDVLLGNATQLASFGNNYFFVVSTRSYGATYYARPVPSNNVWPVGFTNSVTDYLGSTVEETPSRVRWNVYGDNSDFWKSGAGGPIFDPVFALSVVNRGTVKFQAVDPNPHIAGAGGPIFDPILGYSVVNRGTVKFQTTDPNPHIAGAGAGFGFSVSNSRYSIFL